METGRAGQKPVLTPKAIINQRFGGKATYEVEEVHQSTPNACPGLAIPQKGPCLYRCILKLPEFSIVSETFKRKKEAEQSAAEKAIVKLGIQPSTPKVQEPEEELVSRLSYLFSNEFLSCVHPLSGHFRSALRRDDLLNGFVPVSAMAFYDSKLMNLCKCINPEAESNFLLLISTIVNAAQRLPGTVSISEDQLSLGRANPYPPEILQCLDEKEHFPSVDAIIKAVRVPFLIEKSIEPLTLGFSVYGYYLDAIAERLGATDASKVLISRSIGKASSETRMYYCNPKSHPLDSSPEEVDGQLNVRASYLSGQLIYGDAVLASIGYTWKSTDLFHEDVSVQTYYRLLVNKAPSGIYKLSRDAILAAELPVSLGARSNWRGSFPRDILCTFCRQHRLSEPVFSTPLESSPKLPGTHKKFKVTKDSSINDQDSNGGGETFKTEVSIFSRCQKHLIVRCSPEESFKKQSDAIQNASLKVLFWLNKYFSNLHMPLETLTTFLVDGFDVQFFPQHFFKEFAFCSFVHKNTGQSTTSKHFEPNGGLVCPSHRICSTNGRSESVVSLPSGSSVCISYRVYLVREGEDLKQLLESHEEFDFEIGIEAVLPPLEAVVTQMSVGQSASFTMELPAEDLMFAANGDAAQTLPSLTSGCCSLLEYNTTLLRVTEPLEDRIEAALFSPPLSKQRVEYAVQRIKESGATFLADFGCGSGSLLESLLEYSTSLEKIVGVDLSKKSLARAAKILHSKLSANSMGIKSAQLYDGSITVYDSRLYGCDIGTCLEVIEHMEEDQACLFGDIVLSSFCPKVLIVSTPNYEYNVVIQKSTLQSLEEDTEEGNQTQPIKFRNHDHKFEWTREQFSCWACDLANRHNYSVEFSGVGGVAGVEPGFASQIAVFRRNGDLLDSLETRFEYDVIWEWSSTNVPT